VQLGLLSHEYDGNGFWASFGLFGLGMATYVLAYYRRKRKLGDPVVVREVIFGILFFLGLACFAGYQILTHL
jgi:hypothetical protein